MKLTMIAAAAGLIAAPAVAGTVGTPALSAGNEAGIETVAVAFDALKSGENDRAIRQILAEESADPGDPARMINLGTAYARCAAKSAMRSSWPTASGSIRKKPLSGLWRG